MKEINIKVPQGIQYISEWKEYKIPKGHVIIDKGVTGCGYTEFCLTNKDNVILCSPRKLLLENKRDQHKDDLNILYLENKVEDYKGTINLESKIQDHIFNCQGPFQNLPCKFMVTYDSAKYLVKYLYEHNLLGDFYFVVDEFQSIFLDSHFKAEIENDFLDILQSCPNVVYLSATPMLGKYLDMLPEFKNLDFYSLDWSETNSVENVVLMTKNVNYLTSACNDVVTDYLSGKFPISLDKDGRPVESKEAVFYFNSITEILRVVKKNKLTPNNTRIICSDQRNNESRLKKFGFLVGKVPLKNEPNPMFIFCTSTSYIGVDFYSTCASSYIFADPNIDQLALDISMDLPQIVGRQRDKSNPFKNRVTVFYKTQKKPLTRESFDEAQDSRRKRSKNLLDVFKTATKEQQIDLIDKLKRDSELYVHDFIGVSKNTNQLVYNRLIEISNERAWEVSQKDYQDKITVTKSIEELGYNVYNYLTETDIIVQDFLDNHFYKTGVFSEKMKMYCEFRDSYSNNPVLISSLEYKISNPNFKMFYEYYGTKGCKARKYQEADLIRGFNDSFMEDKLREMVISTFKEGNKYTVSDIKTILISFNEKLGISRKAKATDLGKYFEVSKCKVTLQDKSQVHGFRIGKRL